MARTLRVCVLLLLGGLLSACQLEIPADPDGTLHRVKSEGVLRAGASPRPGWVSVTGQRPSGREPELIEEFAASLGATVEWTTGGEEYLVALLEDGDLDVAVGGITDSSPWAAKVGLTRPYTETTERGQTEAHVMMTRLGENAMQSELEAWLDGQDIS